MRDDSFDSVASQASVIPSEVRAEILRRIRAAEEQHDVHVLLAVESGSRAWGFESPNSDYDARFIYIHRRDWYLSAGLEEQRDVIEYPIVDDIDLNGWDARKALRLFARSNPAFVEWVQSPIIYRERGHFAQQVRELLPTVYSVERGIHHYRSMAKNNFRGYLKGELVPLKKYFYVLRPLLSVRWLRRYAKSAPIEFAKLLHLVDDQPSLLADIHDLLIRKRAAPEMGLAAPIASINAFIEVELNLLDGMQTTSLHRQDVMPSLNTVFREALDQAWA